MGAIDTIRFQDQSVRIGSQNFDAMDRVPFSAWAKVAVAMTAAKLEKRKSRHKLMNLDHRELRDIGISVEDADREIRKSFPMYSRSSD